MWPYAKWFRQGRSHGVRWDTALLILKEMFVPKIAPKLTVTKDKNTDILMSTVHLFSVLVTDTQIWRFAAFLCFILLETSLAF